MTIRKEDALEYHAVPTAGKLSVTPTKPCRTQRDLSLAYSPGVAVPCREIERDPALAYAGAKRRGSNGPAARRPRIAWAASRPTA